MATVRIVFDVFDVPEENQEEAMNRLIDQLGSVKTDLSWDEVDWYNWPEVE
jgi:hypothetical protein